MIGLLQVDGKWPNLALMHLGAWLRNQGKEVRRVSFIEQSMCEAVYAAKVFSDSSAAYVRQDALRGGTGWADWKTLPVLPNEAEHTYPAYDLFRCEEAMGYLTRGCIRHCPFCFVPDKEGHIHHHAHLSEWWHGQQTIRLLDANITAHPDCLGYLEELSASKAKVDISQGVDLRLMTPEIAQGLSKIRRWKRLHAAWDRMADEEHILEGLRLLLNCLPKDAVLIYVLIGYDTTEEEDLYRVEKLRELGAMPFVMPYNRKQRYQRAFSRWVNHKAIFKTVPWQKYAYRWVGPSPRDAV